MQVVFVDTNPDLSYIPVSLAPLGSLGIKGCPVHMKQEELWFMKPLNICSHVPSLTEIAARSVHSILRGK
jgi:hypothetical protein